MSRIIAVFKARNMEFFRDVSSLGWNLIFPVVLVFGFSFIFSDDNENLYKVGYLKGTVENSAFLQTKYIQFVEMPDLDKAIDKVRHHQLDLLLSLNQPLQYWINPNSPKSYLLEKILLGSASSGSQGMQREEVQGKEIRYIDWLLPGILAMNMMFSCLFGIGYVVVRYRKNGVLKRLNATPLTSMEFLIAQVLSRLMIISVITVIVYVGCDIFIDFYMQGSYLLLMLILLIGSLCMISLGLIAATRTVSEEFAGGILNVISWPMMILSGVWFSMDGTPEIMQTLSKLLPLTHIVNASRAVMNDGAGFVDVAPELAALSAMTVIFLAVGTWMFRWES